MKLLRFKAKNIFSLGEIDVNLADRGLILVTGHSLDEGSSNGSGKSSIANKGVLWTLYGSTAGGLKADDVLNRHGDTKTGWGEIEFQGVDGAVYNVYRARPARLEFYKDGLDISAKKAAETQKLIDQAVGLDFKSFAHTYMFGQGRLNSYASLPPAEQKAILEQILPVEQLALWVDYTKESFSKLNLSHGHVLQAISAIDAKLSSEKQAYDMATDKFAMWKEAKEREIHVALKSLEEHKAILAQRQERIATAEAELAKLENLESDVALIDGAIEQVNAELNDLTSQLHLIQDRANQWRVAASQNTSKITKIREDECPTCFQKIINEDRLKELHAANETYAAAAATANENVERCGKLYAETNWAKTLKVEQSQSLFHQKMESDTLRKRHAYWSVQLAELKALNDNSHDYVKRAETLAAEKNPFQDMVANFSDILVKTHASRAPLITLRDRIVKEKDHLSWWLKVYGYDIKNRMFENVCNFLDIQTNEYLKRLKNPQLRVQFSTIKTLASGEVKEDFNVRVYSEKGGEGFDTLSGGEQQIVSFAIGKALSDLCKAQTSGSSDISILDEPFTMLDSRNCESLVEFLQKEKGTILLISNDENLINLIPNRIHVTKYKGVTTVDHAV